MTKKKEAYDLIGIGYQAQENYKVAGSIALEKLTKRVENEGIEIKRSFQYSINQNATYTKTIDSSGAKHYIVLPELTDSSDMNMAIALAHELAHFYLIRDTTSSIKKMIIGSENPRFKYKHEIWAWDKAEEILIEEDIMDKETLKGWHTFSQAYPADGPPKLLATYDFSMYRKRALQTYVPEQLGKTIYKSVMNWVAPFIYIYLILAFSIVLINNAVYPFTLLYNVETHGPITSNVEGLNQGNIVRYTFAMYGIVLIYKLAMKLMRNNFTYPN